MSFRTFGVNVNVDKVMRNYVCSGKRNFHVCVLVKTVACHTITVCKICKSTCSHTIISWKTLFVTKSDILIELFIIGVTVQYPITIMYM